MTIILDINYFYFEKNISIVVEKLRDREISYNGSEMDFSERSHC